MKNFTITFTGIERNFDVTQSAVTRNFEIRQGVGPQGPTGAAATVSVGTTTTGAAGTNASVTNSGTSSAAVLNFTIPRGDTGPAGPNSVTSATTSDGTCDLELNTLVVGTGTASGANSVAIGVNHTVSGSSALAIGENCTASATNAIAIGIDSTASGISALAFGNNCTASGGSSFAQGSSTASGVFSRAFGSACVASENYTHAQGVQAKAIHVGASVESDSRDSDVESTTIDEKTFRFRSYRFLGGSATFTENLTVEGTLTADHIHGNLAGSVYAHVRAGETLAKGDPVYISGSHGSGENLIPIVSKADASNAAKMPAVGIMDAALANNANGHMVITGTITELNTNAYAVNSVLYVASGGGFTSTPPAANSQAVAIVERANANNGAVIVKVNGLASSGGNGASDANKLVRFTSTGTIPVASIGGLGTGVATALAVNTGSAGAFVVNGGALGTPSSGTLTSCTGLPISTGVSGLAANVATFLATPTSANLAAAVTDETGTGSLVFATSPTLVTPTIAQINGGTAANDDLTLQGTTNATRTTSYVVLQPNGGNVGIGTTAPTRLLDVNGIARAGAIYLRNNATGSTGGIDNDGNTSAGLWFNNFATFIAGFNGIVFRSSATGSSDQSERMRITQSGEVGIGTASPSAKAMLDLTSTTRGFLPPRMITAQRDAITSVPAGLMVYNTTTNKLNFYNGSAWEAVTSA